MKGIRREDDSSAEVTEIDLQFVNTNLEESRDR